MFALPTDVGGQEQYEGLPLVIMQDHTNDIEALLLALYDRYKLPHPPLDGRIPEDVESVLSMSTKCQVEHIRAVIVEHLEADWPQSLAEWDVLWGVAPRRLFVPFPAPEPCSVIRLARKYDIPTILPAAVYALSCINPRNEEWDPQGSTREIDAWSWDFDAQARWSLLSSTDILTLMKGKDSIISGLLIPFQVDRGPNATSVCTCGQTWLDQHCQLSILMTRRDPLLYLYILVVGACRNSEIYTPCKRAIWHLLVGRRQAIWQSLRKHFDLLE